LAILAGVVVGAGCDKPAPPPATAPTTMPTPKVVRQIKSAPELVAPSAVAPYELGDGVIRIDGREIPIAGTGPIDAIAHDLARVPRELRDVLQTLAISPVPNPNDAYFAEKYKLPVKAGMATGTHGDITIFPYGLAELRGELGDRRAHADDGSMFVKNFMHELGHAWSRIAWRADPHARELWLDAIAHDPSVPSEYARMSLRNSGAPDEDAAEATSLYFLMRGTPQFAAYRAVMPKRFELISKRFAIIDR
jgi:hypothetical protein